MLTGDAGTMCGIGFGVPVLLPCSAAEEENALECGVRPYTVPEILRDVFRQDFAKIIQDFLDVHPSRAAEAVGQREAKAFHLVRLSEPRTESTLRQRICSYAVDLVFPTVVEAAVPSERGETGKRFGMKFRMRYTLDMLSRRCSAPVVMPEGGFPPDRITEQRENRINAYLLPILYTEDYARVARKILEVYYPEALEAPTAVDGWELCARMNLHARLVRFAEDKGVQGRIYFDEATVRLRDESGSLKLVKVAPMTILINRNCCPTEEIVNSTLVHECCHVFLHSAFFRLQMLSGRSCRAYSSRKTHGRKFSAHNGPVGWLELQAEKLPAYVLMEEKNTRREIEKLLILRGGWRTPENMAWVMDALAKKFRVSRAMAKYRMIELGYWEAEGIYVFLGRERIPDYGCSGKWEEGVTYAITRADAGALLQESRGFAAALLSGRYVYAEGHYCLDLPRYVWRDGAGRPHLTSHARRHIEECCLAFAVCGRFAGAEYEGTRIARKTPVRDVYQSRHTFVAEPETKAREKENDLFLQDAQLWAKLEQAMPDEVGGAVQLILNEKGISQLELSMRLGCSRAAVCKWCAGRMSLRHVTAICIALDVRADIALELVRLSGHAFRNTLEEKVMKAMLYETRDLSVGRANEIMRQYGLPPLTEGRDEEIAC